MRKPVALVYCERIDNESFCVSVIRALERAYEVRPFGPGWPVESLDDLDTSGARFYLELDSASGKFCHPEGLGRLRVPKFAWLIDTHKKPDFHRAIARDVDFTFYAMKTWGHILEGRTTWLPLHCDTSIFYPVECERDLDIVFVGSQSWRADPIQKIAERHGLRILVECTTGPREKSETAAIYARTRLVYNRHVTNDLNFRVFEALACGRVLLTDAQWNGQYDLFQDGRHLLYYKDDEDLERLVLESLANDEARSRIEREAAALAQRFHSTEARVAQLRDAIEAIVTGHTAAHPERAPAEGRGESKGPKRWVFFAGDESPTVTGRSYAETLAHGLQERGHEVTVTRAQRGPIPTGNPIEWSAGPIPDPGSPQNRLLALAGPLHARLDELVRQGARPDVLVGEGALGGLVVAPLAKRLGIPFLLALERCEVARRQNHLTREQLHLAELEQWSLERAAAVLVPNEETKAAIERHYKARRVLVVPATPDNIAASEGHLLDELGLAEGYVLVLARDIGDGRDLLRGTQGVVLVTDEVTVTSTGELSSRPARGPALAALLAGARAVVALDREDPRLRDAAALGVKVAIAPGASGSAILALAERARLLPAPEDALDSVEEAALVLQ